MNNWTELLLNPEKINNIFSNAKTLLKAVELHEFSLHRDGPTITLRFDVANFPEDPPSKWLSQNFNRVQIQMTLIGVRAVSVQGWSNKTRLDLNVVGQDANVRVMGENEFLKIDASAEFARIDSISAYRDQG